MRSILLVSLAACSNAEEEGLPEGGCEGLVTHDSGDDGTIDRQRTVVVDAENRTLEQSALEEGRLVVERYVYDETGLIDESWWLDGLPIFGTRWERRTDGQPLREERWVDEANADGPMGGEGVIFYEYEGDNLSLEIAETFTRAHHRDEHGRVVRIETDYQDGYGINTTEERWYSAPAPELDGGSRRDVGRDGRFESEMEMWYDGEDLIAFQGWYWLGGWSWREGTYRWRSDGQLAAETGQIDLHLFESETTYNWRGLPSMSLRTNIHPETGEAITSRTDWSWRCPSGI